MRNIHEEICEILEVPGRALAQDNSGTCPCRWCLSQARHTGWVTPDRQPVPQPRACFGHQSILVSEDCGSQPPGCFNQRKVMKRLEGMIYGERLASEESRGRKENSLKVVEITEAVSSRVGREEVG